MSIDREYVLAALTGLMFIRMEQRPFVDKYAVSPPEQRRCAEVAVMMAMQGCGSKPEHSRELARELASRYDINPDQLRELAWKVVRGALDDVEGEEHLHFVFDNFLRDVIPPGEMFVNAGSQLAFHPADTETLPEGIIGDLVLRDTDALSPAQECPLPDELREIYQDAGIIKEEPTVKS
ncbi:MAG: hypothetical protein Q8Q20_00695 [bacterium]|nr:hypothetical protein [bacterium]